MHNGHTALANLTGWQPASLNALLMRFTGATALGPLGRHRDFRARVRRAGDRCDGAGLGRRAARGPDQRADGAAVASLQSALRAQYASADWLAVVKPINDPLRIAQRDALVAYCLQAFKSNPPPNATSDGVDTADKLFEFFLIDVENAAAGADLAHPARAVDSCNCSSSVCCAASRRKPRPATSTPQQWSWMKRYRVWQANREVFLWPENWLYPELRDDQTPMLQAVVERAAAGRRHRRRGGRRVSDYLASLEQIAKLEPCGIWYVPAGDGSSGGGVSHGDRLCRRAHGGRAPQALFPPINGRLLVAVDGNQDRLRGHAADADRLERTVVPVLASHH